MISISDLKKFLPCTINLDPYLRKLIRTSQQNAQQTQQLLMGPDIPLGLYSTPPKLNSSTKSATDPSESVKLNNMRRNSLNRSAGKQRMGAFHPSHMMPYGPMIHPHPMMGMPNPYMMGMAGLSTGSVDSWNTIPSAKKTTPPGRYITDYTGEQLSKMSTVEVSNLLARISGINHHQLIIYQQAVMENNINGMVLFNCDLDDLGKCMEMKFGDWQLFRNAVQALRDAEENSQPESPVEESELTSSFAKNNRTGSETSTRSIHFSSSDFTPSGEDVDQPRPSRSSFRRQVSVETQREGNESSSQFDIITEEDGDDDDDVKSLPEVRPGMNMRRNDSVVAEVMYESGLLHEFMHNFTENISGEDEEEDEDFDDGGNNRLVPNGTVVDWVNSGGGVNDKDSVTFNIADMTVSESGLSDDAHSWKANEAIDLENEPLLSQPVRFNTPQPEVPAPKSQWLKRQHHTVTETYSEPDLVVAQKEEDTDNYRDNQPLLTVNKSISTSSSGFNTLHPQTGGESIDVVNVVDETSDGNLGNQSGQGSTKSVSLEQRIEQFTRDQLAGTSRSSSAEPSDVKTVSDQPPGDFV